MAEENRKQERNKERRRNIEGGTGKSCRAV